MESTSKNLPSSKKARLPYKPQTDAQGCAVLLSCYLRTFPSKLQSLSVVLEPRAFCSHTLAGTNPILIKFFVPCLKCCYASTLSLKMLTTLCLHLKRLSFSMPKYSMLSDIPLLPTHKRPCLHVSTNIRNIHFAPAFLATLSERQDKLDFL